MVMERLADLAGEYPTQCLEVLKSLILRDKQGWNVLRWVDNAQIVLQAALKATESRENAKGLIHELGARGNFQFRELL